MYKKIIVAIILFISFTNINAQKVISGYLIDSLTNNPISDVEITDLSTKEVFFSGYNGFFKIPINNKKFIVLKFSHISYDNKILNIPAGFKNTDIYLAPNNKNLNSVIISANRTKTLEKNQPLNFTLINKNDNININYSSIDDYIKYSSLINIIRPSGIFSNSPIITISGNGAVAGRTLVLFDGIHLNKSDDGNVNWNMFPANSIKRIEISHNPLSTLYGNNAFSGVINFIPELPTKKGFSGFANIHYGSLNTYGLEIAPSYKHFGNKGLFFRLDAFAQKSAGYIQTPDSMQLPDITYLPTALQEIKTNLIVGYDFNRNQKIKIILNYFDDTRGLGIKIKQDNGTYTKHRSKLAIIKYSADFDKTNFGINLSAQQENYFKTIESLKKNKYSLIYVNSLRQDLELNVFVNHNFEDIYTLTAGINSQIGQVLGIDQYQTSSDIVTNKGKLFNNELYLQNVLNPLKNDKILFLAGININQTKIISPEFMIDNATKATDFMQPFTGTFDDNLLKNYSFNTGIKFNLTNYFNIFTSYNTGENNPTLEDLTRSGFMRLGFKIANPKLKPENISNLSAGFKYQKQKILFSADFNYDKGSNYMYYLETGESLFGGKKKIVQKQNITNVKIYNSNISFKFIEKRYVFFANYSFNNSFISKFDSIPQLEGKYLVYSPMHIAHAGFLLKIENIRASLIANYFSKQYTDDYNEQFIPAYYTFDANISVDLLSYLTLGFSVQNILNYQYLIYNDQLSIGRFMQLSLRYKFK